MILLFSLAEIELNEEFNTWLDLFINAPSK